MRERQPETTEQLVDTLAAVLDVADDEQSDAEVGAAIRRTLAERGSVTQPQGECETVSACIAQNYPPLLWCFFRLYRGGLLRLVHCPRLRSTSEDRTIILALRAALDHERGSGQYLREPVDLSFASEAWQRMIVVRQGRRKLLLRRPFEVRVFTYVARELQAGDLAVGGSHACADYREQLLSWDACAPLVADYYARPEFPATAADFAASRPIHLSREGLLGQDIPFLVGESPTEKGMS